jgi:hypothetical protein
MNIEKLEKIIDITQEKIGDIIEFCHNTNKQNFGLLYFVIFEKKYTDIDGISYPLFPNTIEPCEWVSESVSLTKSDIQISIPLRKVLNSLSFCDAFKMKSLKDSNDLPILFDIFYISQNKKVFCDPSEILSLVLNKKENYFISFEISKVDLYKPLFLSCTGFTLSGKNRKKIIDSYL